MNIPDVSAILSNPVFAGGAGIGLLGGLTYAIRSLPERITGGLTFALTSSITVTSRYDQFEDVIRYLGRYRLNWTHRAYAPSDDNDRTLTVGYGSGYGNYLGCLLRYHRSLEKSDSGRLSETITITFLTRDRRVLQRFFDEASVVDTHDTVRVVAGTDFYGDDVSITRRKRPMSTVFINEETRDRLIDRYAQFVRDEDLYVGRGINYKFCALFYGPPGTGKTSLIHAFASMHDFRLRFVSSLDSIPNLLSNYRDDDVIVLEDVDALSGKLKRVEGGDDIEKTARGTPVIHALLNMMDGFQTPHGLKMIMTTNHIDRLDPAMLRDGRMDLKLEIGPLDISALRTMFAAFYGADQAAKFDGGGVLPRTGASAQKLFLSLTPEDAVEALQKEERNEVSHSDY